MFQTLIEQRHTKGKRQTNEDTIMKSTTTVNLNEVVFEAVIKAKEQANLAQQEYYNQKMSGREWGCCGFAWAVAQVKGNTKMGKALLAAGFTKNYGGGLQVWMPGRIGTQNIDCNYAGAKKFAEVLKAELLKSDLSIEVYADSRVD